MVLTIASKTTLSSSNKKLDTPALAEEMNHRSIDPNLCTVSEEMTSYRILKRSLNKFITTRNSLKKILPSES